MTIKCNLCGRIYNDATRWTLCPHGPLWAAHDAYCPQHDLVDCSVCKAIEEEYRKEDVKFIESNYVD